VSGSRRRQKIFRALNHDFRKRLLEKIAEGRITYTELLKWGGVESGYLAYHLRSMEGLLEKGEEGYTLTPLGLEGISMLHGQVEGPQPILTRSRVLAITLIAALLTSGIYLAYSLTALNQTTQLTREQRVAALRTHAGEALTAITGAFDYVEIPRSVWAEVVVHVALLRQDIEALQIEDPSAISEPLVRNIDYFLGESTKVLSSPDATYFSLSRENRQLLRDLHYSIFTLNQGLVDVL
jgi:hypothetical protein